MVYVINASGPYDNNCPSGYESWIDFWAKKKNIKPSWCRNCRVTTNELCGGHVNIVEKGSYGKWCRLPDLYITPLCAKCNHPENDDIFQVDEKDLVRI